MIFGGKRIRHLSSPAAGDHFSTQRRNDAVQVAEVMRPLSAPGKQ
jgi:hypothetical protein